MMNHPSDIALIQLITTTKSSPLLDDERLWASRRLPTLMKSPRWQLLLPPPKARPQIDLHNCAPNNPSRQAGFEYTIEVSSPYWRPWRWEVQSPLVIVCYTRGIFAQHVQGLRACWWITSWPFYCDILAAAQALRHTWHKRGDFSTTHQFTGNSVHDSFRHHGAQSSACGKHQG